MTDKTSDRETLIADLLKALREVESTNGGDPVDRNNRMKRTARKALAKAKDEKQ